MVLITFMVWIAFYDIGDWIRSGGKPKPVGKVVIGTVKGDLHDIGKNLVAMMLEGAGFEIVDLGTDVTPEKFAEAMQREYEAMHARLRELVPSIAPEKSGKYRYIVSHALAAVH